jgi:hypothetical protein
MVEVPAWIASGCGTTPSLGNDDHFGVTGGKVLGQAHLDLVLLGDGDALSMGVHGFGS